MNGIVRSFGFMWRRLIIRICEGAVLTACFVMIMIGCGRSWLERKHAEAAGQSGGAASAVVTVTNVVEVTREVVITNTVTMTVTNVVNVSAAVAAPSLSARKTRPYVVESEVLSGTTLQRAVSDGGARLVAVRRVSQAVVEAGEGAAKALGSSSAVSVRPLSTEEKLRGGVGVLGGKVRIFPLSSIDASAVSAAVVALGGMPREASVGGRTAVEAELSADAVVELAGRGDVRLIEKGE